MPKTKDNKKYRKQYTEEQLSKALAAISDGRMRKLEASRAFGIPRSTLLFRLSGGFTKAAHGPIPTLLKDEESQLVNWLLECSKRGFPRRKEGIQASVKRFLDIAPRPNPFTDNIPGDGWFRSFMRRNPILIKNSAEFFTTGALVDESSVRRWFARIENYLKQDNLFDILKDPSRIYNCDETSFSVCHKLKNITGFKSGFETHSDLSKLSLTVLFTFSVSGQVSPPFIVYPYMTTSKPIVDSMPSSWGKGISYNGLMTAEFMAVYLKNVFYPHLVKIKATLPVIVFVTGHASHITMEVSEVCRELKIILICLFPNPSKFLQPEGVEAFQLMKKLWLNAVQEWRKDNSSLYINIDDTVPILDIVYSQFLSEKDMFAQGFRAYGIFPWDVDRVQYSKCLSTTSKKPPTEKKLISNEMITMKLNDFVGILGNDMISDFEQNADRMVSSRNPEELYKKLYQLYATFTSSGRQEREDMAGNFFEVQIKTELDLSD